MKFNIKDENNITLWIERTDEGVYLMGEDKEEIKKTILRFADGQIYPIENAQLKGLKTDNKGRVVVNDD